MIFVRKKKEETQEERRQRKMDEISCGMLDDLYSKVGFRAVIENGHVVVIGRV